MRHRRAVWSVAIVVCVVATSTAWALPAAADLTLAGGDGAAVSGTNGDGVNVRLDPGADSSIVSTLPEGCAVTVLDGPVTAIDGSAWYAVTADTAEGTIEGWVVADYLAGSGGTLWVSNAEAIAPDDSDDAARGAIAIVATDGEPLNLRAGAWAGSDALGSLPDGATAEVLEPILTDSDGGSWSLVRYDGSVGYVASLYLSTDLDALRTATDEATSLATVEGGLTVGTLAGVSGTGGDGVFVRAEPSQDALEVSSLYDGDTGRLIDGPVQDIAGNAWYLVETYDSTGWIHGVYLTSVAATSAGDAIVMAASEYLGVPYLWGGTTPDGFDCSGFTYYILSQVLGYGIDRPIEDQLTSGSYVAPDELLPGDLIFFQNTYQWGLSHVGFYIGNGQFISATGQFDAVGISDLSDPYWSARYLEARRVG